MIPVSRRSLVGFSAFGLGLFFQGKAATAEPAKAAVELGPENYRADAEEIIPLIRRNYAYRDHLPNGGYPDSTELKAALNQVTDRASLIAYAEKAIMALGDHHAITGSALSDSWALVPSYADLWIEYIDGHYEVTAVRANCPAAQAGIVPGNRLTAYGDLPFDQAVKDFWQQAGGPLTDSRKAYGARVLAAGRRDRIRDLTLSGLNGQSRRLKLPSLYSQPLPHPPEPISVSTEGSALKIVFNDSLGETATIEAFDTALRANARPRQAVILDLTNTPGGGNTTVARAVMGWFVRAARPYQVHELTSEFREHGVQRRWVEQVLPRDGKHYDGPVTVRVGRWTGSMGEGMAIGFDALGARVEGDRMAGLLGAIYDYRLPHSGLVIKIPAERLSHVNDLPREDFVPLKLGSQARP
jgi:hypothetical protein